MGRSGSPRAAFDAAADVVEQVGSKQRGCAFSGPTVRLTSPANPQKCWHRRQSGAGRILPVGNLPTLAPLDRMSRLALDQPRGYFAQPSMPSRWSRIPFRVPGAAIRGNLVPHKAKQEAIHEIVSLRVQGEALISHTEAP